jgi:hypothetical protein
MRSGPGGIVNLLRHVLVMILLGASSHALCESSPLEKSEARVLVLAALQRVDDAVKLYELPETYSPGFYVFEVVSLNPRTSLVIGRIAVNPETADVWDTAGTCRKLDEFGGLRKLQDELRKRHGMSGTQSKRPSCDAAPRTD